MFRPQDSTRMLLVYVFSLAVLFSETVATGVYFSNYNFGTMYTGQSFTLEWFGDETAVDIAVYNGPTDNLQYIRNVTTNNTAAYYVWTVPLEFPTDKYTLQIFQSNISNRSPPILIQSAATHMGNGNSSTPIALPLYSAPNMTEAPIDAGSTKIVPPPMMIWVEGRQRKLKCDNMTTNQTQVMEGVTAKTVTITASEPLSTSGAASMVGGVSLVAVLGVGTLISLY